MKYDEMVEASIVSQQREIDTGSDKRLPATVERYLEGYLLPGESGIDTAGDSNDMPTYIPNRPPEARHTLTLGSGALLAQFRAENPYARDEQFQRDFLEGCSALAKSDTETREYIRGLKARIDEAYDTENTAGVRYLTWLNHELFPDSAISASKLAILLTKENWFEYKNLIPQLHLFAFMRNKSSRECANLILFYRKSGNYQLALNLLEFEEKFFSEPERRSQQLNIRATLLTDLGRYDEALRTLGEVPEEERNVVYHTTRANVLVHKGDFKEAGKQRDVFLASAETQAEGAYLSLLMAYHTSDFVACQKAYDFCIKNKVFPNLKHQRAWMLKVVREAYRAGDADSGFAVLRSFDRHQWTRKEFVLEAGLFYVIKNYRAARMSVVEALKLDMHNESALWMYAKILAALGEIHNAKLALMKLVRKNFQFNYGAALLYLIEQSPSVSAEEESAVAWIRTHLDEQDEQCGNPKGSRFDDLSTLAKTFTWRDVEMDSDEDILFSQLTANPFNKFAGAYDRPVERTRGNTHRPTNYGRPGKK